MTLYHGFVKPQITEVCSLTVSVITKPERWQFRFSRQYICPLLHRVAHFPAFDGVPDELMIRYCGYLNLNILQNWFQLFLIVVIVLSWFCYQCFSTKWTFNWMFYFNHCTLPLYTSIYVCPLLGLPFCHVKLQVSADGNTYVTISDSPSNMLLAGSLWF